jgi:hypothetical protein
MGLQPLRHSIGVIPGINLEDVGDAQFRKQTGEPRRGCRNVRKLVVDTVIQRQGRKPAEIRTVVSMVTSIEPAAWEAKKRHQIKKSWPVKPLQKPTHL